MAFAVLIYLSQTFALKNLLAFITALLLCLAASTQVTWNPQWQKGKTETLEFSTSDRKVYANNRIETDTTHGFIKVKETDENEFFYFLEWKFGNYFEDTSKAIDNSQKMIYITISRLMAAAPVRVRIEKSNFEIIILNRDRLDSLQKVIAAQVAETYPSKKAVADKELEEAVNMLVSLKTDDRMYELISDYYSIYAVNGIEFNVKHDMGNVDFGIHDSVFAQVQKASSEFYVLDDKDPLVYKWRYEAKIDWSKLSVNIRDAVKSKPAAFKSIGDVTTDITITKADKLVSYFHYLSDDGSRPGSEARHEVVEKTIKKIN
jgi:hypothetical protein